MSDRPPVTLELYEHRDDPGHYYFKIGIRGILSPHQKSYGEVEANVDNLEKTVETVAGALAERQNEILGEFHDPDEVAAYARKMLRDLIAKIQK